MLSQKEKEEIENRLKECALDGLVNIYHAITGQTCERYNSLGLATSAVSAMMQECASLLKELQETKAWVFNQAIDAMMLSEVGGEITALLELAEREGIKLHPDELKRMIARRDEWNR